MRLDRRYQYCTGMGYELVPNEPRFWEFIRDLRSDDRVRHGFVEQVKITEEQQKAYMEKYADCYYVLVSTANNGYHTGMTRIQLLGFIGVVDNDIRLCVDPLAQGNGWGKEMLRELQKKMDLSSAVAKVKHNNIASQKCFLATGFEQFNEDENFKYYRLKNG